MTIASSLTSPLHPQLHSYIGQAIVKAGGWLGFDRFMEMALYTPGWGYYASDSPKFGLMPQGVRTGAESSASDFVTASRKYNGKRGRRHG